jgi:predicted Kef-type K+ transport protein
LLLGSLIAIEFTRQTLVWNIPAGVLLGLALSAAIGWIVYRRFRAQRLTAGSRGVVGGL